MIDKIIMWCIKLLIRFWDRHDDKLAYTFYGSKSKDYNIIVERFFDDYCTFGTKIIPVNKPPKEEEE